jgi:hypothetical protein
MTQGTSKVSAILSQCLKLRTKSVANTVSDSASNNVAYTIGYFTKIPASLETTRGYRRHAIETPKRFCRNKYN